MFHSQIANEDNPQYAEFDKAIIDGGKKATTL